ncbi:MAG: YihY/virulence factor BrkB family protein [Bacteroidota bacterium]|nr:YihY/virulence factor BrkB family protein [Candidatus Kapabacteria bacterium]MDW8221281.1 YihY/virulence factor BrkB family protein [Bacteroidota bacterium]
MHYSSSLAQFSVRHAIKRGMVAGRSAWRLVRRILRRADEHHIYLAAAGIAFNILLFILPTILVVIFVISAFTDRAVVIAAIEDFLLDVLPSDGGLDAAIDIIKFEVNTVLQNSDSAAWIGFPTLFWFSLTLFGSIRTALNTVFGFRQERRLWSAVRRDFLLLGLFIGAVLLSNAMPQITHSVAEWTITTVTGSEIVKSAIVTGVSLSILYIFFVSLYMCTPNRLPPVSVVLVSALCSVVFWQCARVGFGFYIKHIASYGKVYGIYATVVALAFWVYYSALLILLSGEIAQYWYEARRRRKLAAKIGALRAPDEYAGLE